MTRILFAIVLTLTPAAAHGAEIMLRESVALSGSIVRLSDIAEIVAATPEEAAEFAAIPLFPSPAPGTTTHVSVSQLRDLLAANAVDVGLVEIRGAAAVAVSKSAVAAPETLSGDGIDVKPERDDVSQRIAAELVNYLRTQTGHELWEVAANIDSKLVDLCWKTRSQLVISGGVAPWTGRQRFDVAGATGIPPLRVYANVVRVEMVVVAVRPIASGDFVRATDVALRPYAGQTSDHVVKSLDQVIGKEARQVIRENAILSMNQVRSPLLVHKGERVTVRARAGSVVVRTYGTVQQDGGLGELVQVQALEGTERCAARVSGLRELEVFAAAAAADEVVAAAK